MAAIAKENLDERIERIKKRNEEIEKKHREAEEDRLRALKDNAMVETKPPKDEDWPKGHKYDKIDFTYDVKPEKLEELKQKRLEEMKAKRDYKKFPDGEGPPPDPAYNFLADAERDGIINIKSENKNEKKDSRQNNKSRDANKRGGPNNNSFRGRGGKPYNAKQQKHNPQPEYEQWRSEREKIDEARINRQKVGDGKWKREWDNDKMNSENEALLRPERVTLGDAVNAASKKSPTHGAKQNHQNSGRNISSADCLIEKRGNITVSVSQTGEVKSVKLTSAPAIGTGRVGPRQHPKPQFSVQTVEREITVHQVPASPRPHNKDHKHNQNTQHKSPLVNRKLPQEAVGSQNSSVLHSNNQGKHKRKPHSPKFVPQQNVIIPDPSTVATPIIAADLPIQLPNGVVPVDLSHKPEFAKRSVQDRLLRIRQGNQNDSGIVKVVTNDLCAPSNDNKKEETNGELNGNHSNTNGSIPTAEPIAACN